MLGRKIKLVGVGRESSGWSGKPYPNRRYLSGNLRIPGGRAYREGEWQVQRWRRGHLSALSSQRHDPASPTLAPLSSLLPPVRLMAPNSLQVTHLETHRCNITWKVSQFSHYIERYLEFETQTRFPGHSWEVSTRPSASLPWSSPGPGPLSILHLSKATAAPRQPPPLL